MPWLLVLSRTRTLAGAAASGYFMCLAFVLAIFAWFGLAIAVYSAGAAFAGIVVLALAAPLLQPQFLVFAIVRHAARRFHGPLLAAIAGASAWVAAEWMFPKLLADSLAHGFYPSPVLRQTADLGGIAGITFLIVLINEALCEALSAAVRRDPRASLAAVSCAALIIAAMAGYGTWRLHALAASQGIPPVRVGLVQSNISAYDRLKREMGAYEAVRHVLDTHFAMSREAVDKNHVDALVWSETVFPTTFGKPKNETGGELDQEIEDFVARLGVPLVFGSYDRDEDGEYNSAVFLEPGAVGAPAKFSVYRKTRLFFLTEYVPAWLDGPRARQWMPWAGTWKPGPGAKVLPLRLRGGRTVPVLPMICLDDVDVGLAVEGARRGAEMIVTMSNDSWFTEHAEGAWLHLVVAAFRSIETRLPQIRVTNNGITAVIDPTGEITSSAGVGERSTLVADVVPQKPARTLVVALGDWVGPTGLVVVLLLVGVPLVRRRGR